MNGDKYCEFQNESHQNSYMNNDESKLLKNKNLI